MLVACARRRRNRFLGSRIHPTAASMGELAASPPAPVLLPVVFVDGDQTVDLGTVTVDPSLGVKRLQAVVADRVGLAPHQISASLARPRRAPLDDATTTDLAAAVAREGAGCYVLAALRRSSRRARRGKKSAATGAPPPEKKTILKRLPPTDLAAPVFGWDYEAQLRELQRQRDWYLVNTAAAAPPDPSYFPLAPPPDPPLWSPRCRECEAAAAARRDPGFHWCVRDAVTVGFRSPVGPIERPGAKIKPASPPPSPGRMHVVY